MAQLGVYDSRDLLCKAVFYAVGPLPVLVPGIIPSQVQNLALLVVELREVPLSQLLQPVQVPLDGSTSIWCMSHSSQFCVAFKTAGGYALSPHPSSL